MNFENGVLKKVVEMALKNDFTVYRFQNENVSQVIIGNDTGVCTIQGEYGGIKICTCHKPNRRCGTGFVLTKYASNLTLKELKEACLIFAPYWASHADRQVIKKYGSISEYIKSETILTYTQIKEI